MYYLDLLVIGLVWGCTYAMMALGLTLVYGLLRILHVAQATVFTLGAYAGVLTANASGSLALAFVVAVVSACVAGVLIYRLVYEPLLSKPPFVPLVASIGLLIAMEDGFRLLFGPMGCPLPESVVCHLDQCGGYSAQHGSACAGVDGAGQHQRFGLDCKLHASGCWPARDGYRCRDGRELRG